ncbi:MAG: NADH-quinone oxidoreductase subunit M [Anaerolineae bacterium]|nr:NADH-quinone oxidoreductase subunit M [Anaerolineae bacterium]
METVFPTFLTVLLAIPVVGFLVIILTPRTQENFIKWTAVFFTLVTFVVSLALLSAPYQSSSELFFAGAIPWIPTAGISYALGVDGLSLWLVLLTTLLGPIVVISSWTAVEERVKEYYAFLVLLETAMLGVFLAQDMFLFYVFWEFTLVPMYFLIGIWGGSNRQYASIKFFLYTKAGSILMLLAILFLGIKGGTFLLPDLIGMDLGIGTNAARWLFLGFAIAFAIKVPIWPLHSWLPDAHVEAPTAGSVILAGVLLKMGTYGFVRFNIPLFPEASQFFAPAIAVLAVIGIIYGAWVSFAQTDVKKLVAYSSVSHLGFVMLGLFALNEIGIQGAILQMVNHGLSTGALFLMVGMIYERRHTRDMAQFGGIWQVMPVYSALMLIVTLSSMGLPGLNGFVGEFTILMGAFNSSAFGFQLAGIPGSVLLTALSTLGVIGAAIYLLTMFQKVFLGPVTVEANRSLKDISARELVSLLPLLVLIFWIGIFPSPFFNVMTASVQALVHALPAMAVLP